MISFAAASVVCLLLVVDTLGDSTFRTVGAHDVGLTPAMVFDVDKFLAEVAIKTKVLNSF